MSKLGVLLIGGKRSHQESHAAIFTKHPRCRLVAVADEADAPAMRHDLTLLINNRRHFGRVQGLNIVSV